LRVTAETLEAHFNGVHQNIGVLLGKPSAWLVDVDLDCPEALVVAESLLPDTGCIFGRRSGNPDSHHLFVSKVARPLDQLTRGVGAAREQGVAACGSQLDEHRALVTVWAAGLDELLRRHLTGRPRSRALASRGSLGLLASAALARQLAYPRQA
jgi:hypothetical protein